MDEWIIYKATNIKTKLSYIGQSKKYNERKKNHINLSKDGTTKFYKAIQEYGIDAFEWDIIQKEIYDKNDANYSEAYWIWYYDSFENGYNSVAGNYKVSGFVAVEHKPVKIMMPSKMKKHIVLELFKNVEFILLDELKIQKKNNSYKPIIGIKIKPVHKYEYDSVNVNNNKKYDVFNEYGGVLYHNVSGINLNKILKAYCNRIISYIEL